MNFENPWLLILIPLILLFVYLVARSGKKSYFIHPWAQQIYARCGSGKFRSRFILVLLLISALAMAVIIARPWQGTTESEQTEQVREVSVEVDVSGSMFGDPEEAAVNAAKYLIDKRPKDKVNLVFFASESVATSFGISSAYLTKERVNTLSAGLGDSTVVGTGLFTTFVAIAREDEIFGPGQETEEALKDIFVRIPGNHSGVGTPENRSSFKTYLSILLKKHPIKPADRLVIFVSDCDLSYNDYDFESVMELYTKYNIRIETICIGGTNPPLAGNSDKTFAKIITALGGHINRVNLPDLKDDLGVLGKTLKSIVDRIDKQKPRAILASTNMEKRPMTRVFILMALVAFILSKLLSPLRWFRINS